MTKPAALRRGRPATGITKAKLSATVSPALIKAAGKDAAKRGESLSQWVSRAIQNQLLNSLS
jgi:predicted HicB family RNase H-like nuclease